MFNSNSLRKFAWLSIAAAILTIGLKGAAYWITGSVSLLSDAIESLVNLAAAVVALAMIIVSERPPDDEHAYGHGKAEYFSSGFEGALILVAAGAIAWSALQRLFNLQPLEQVWLGLAISVIATLINLAVALVLARAGRKHNSITLEADSKHLMTDVWTTAGVLLGVAAVALTGWLWLDPVIALIMAANILRSGIDLIRRSVLGLMDSALPQADLQIVNQVLAGHRQQGIEFHALRTRQSGVRRFIAFHVMVPDEWTVGKGHTLAEEIETEVRNALPGAIVFSHIEPLEDPLSLADIEIDRV